MKAPQLLVTTLIVTALWQGSDAAPAPPNIVFIVADDLGWNDVGFHNPAMITPTIDKLAKEGVILDQNYVQPLCSPSRSALMTGVYPFRMGLQHLVILPQQPVCVPLNRTLIPQHLKAKGYMTHMVGKWHLGFCKWECTPTYRGFDSFYGYYNAQEDYYNKTFMGGYDFRDNKTCVKDVIGNYSTYQHLARIRKVIANHDARFPLFMYLPFQNVHDPLEVPKKYYDMYPNITDHSRRTFSGMITALDDAVAEVIKSLKAKGLYDNTLIAFTADNGGWITYSGNNYPLRGGKFTIYEGGTRAVSFVHGPMFNRTGIKYEGLMHIVDWLPTLMEAAGIKDPLGDIDGVSQWGSLLNVSRPSPRTEVVYNLDPSLFAEQGKAAIRVGDYKLVDGFPGLYPGWYKPAGVDGNAPSDNDHQLFPFMSPVTGDVDQSAASEYLARHPELTLYKALFNLREDPTEHKNLYHEKPDVVKQLEARLEYHKTRMVKPNFPKNDPKGASDKWGGVWTPGWC